MGKYIIKRLLQLIPVLIGITFLSFAMMRLAGGDAVTYMYEIQALQYPMRSLIRRRQNMALINHSLYNMLPGLREW